MDHHQIRFVSLAGKTSEEQMAPAFGVMIALSDALLDQSKNHPTSTSPLGYRRRERDSKRPNGSSGQKNKNISDSSWLKILTLSNRVMPLNGILDEAGVSLRRDSGAQKDTKPIAGRET